MMNGNNKAYLNLANHAKHVTIILQKQRDNFGLKPTGALQQITISGHISSVTIRYLLEIGVSETFFK